MGRSAGRTPEQTRRLLLDAAGSVIRTRGIAATLDEIADAAGISKGGLIYHFASKDQLILALATDALDAFRTAVLNAVDVTEPSPGQLTRAYIRCCFDVSHNEPATREDLRLAVQLMSSADVNELNRLDSMKWDEDLRADGLPDDVLTLVIAAADGVSSAPLWGGLTDTQHYNRLRDQLIAMTFEPPRS
ncbi:TetR/AcrR family transcriptional regulator [Aeromicrobium sp. P5_D10]